MDLTSEKIVIRVLKYLKNPSISIKLSSNEQTEIYFYSIFLNFTDITDREKLTKELSNTYKKEVVSKIFEEKRIKLEDIFAKYIGKEILSNSNETKLQAKKIAEEYKSLISSDINIDYN